MFTIVVYCKETKKIVLALPLEFHNPTRITQARTLEHKDYGYRVYCEMRPVIYEDGDGDLCLKDDSFIINSEDLK